MLAMLEKSNRELESFAYITSHDLQEPLRKIQAFGERLTKNYGEGLGEEGTDFIQRMRSAASRMQVMVNDLLTYSRITTRAGEFVEVDLNRIASEVIEDLEIRIADSGGQVIVERLPKIMADASQMRQLLQNLTVNGLKFHRRNVPPVVKISSQESAVGSQSADGNQPVAGDGEKANHEIMLIIEDNGIGFDEKYAERIFLPFQRLHSQDVFEGTGIGLAICRKIAERHGGTITAHSTPAVGSRFVIRLPRHLINVEGDLHEPQ
jgi:light-regulated signal transduction histidine kinase (bacteriophytochrome)